MKSNILLFIGLQVLFLAHAANSFVLLTANVDDIKKIARKFLSDNLAEQIAGFIVNASQTRVIDVSGENDKNKDIIDRISTEKLLDNEIGNRVKQPSHWYPEKAVKGNDKKIYPKKFSTVGKIAQSDYNSLEMDNNYKKDKDIKDGNIDMFNYDKYEKIKNGNKGYKRKETRLDLETTKENKYYQKQIKNIENSNVKYNREAVDADIHRPIYSRGLHDNSYTQNKHTTKKLNRIPVRKPVADIANNTKTTKLFQGFNIDRARDEKADKSEFDQYEGALKHVTENPVKEFVATSGNVGLPKIQAW